MLPIKSVYDKTDSGCLAATPASVNTSAFAAPAAAVAAAASFWRSSILCLRSFFLRVFSSSVLVIFPDDDVASDDDMASDADVAVRSDTDVAPGSGLGGRSSAAFRKLCFDSAEAVVRCAAGVSSDLYSRPSPDDSRSEPRDADELLLPLPLVWLKLVRRAFSLVMQSFSSFWADWLISATFSTGAASSGYLRRGIIGEFSKHAWAR
eukprot:COSAG05_NODE_180_length_14817_cov_423.925262_2_plen_207_part_00